MPVDALSYPEAAQTWVKRIPGHSVGRKGRAWYVANKDGIILYGSARDIYMVVAALYNIHHGRVI